MGAKPADRIVLKMQVELRAWTGNAKTPAGLPEFWGKLAQISTGKSRLLYDRGLFQLLIKLFQFILFGLNDLE